MMRFYHIRITAMKKNSCFTVDMFVPHAAYRTIILILKTRNFGHDTTSRNTEIEWKIIKFLVCS